ncbi:hypothetical protein F3087_17030 [Nocardia colli]|uniref:Uncharacterized protein n=1 Tax=Nocardia colli TaxID=2545717 RepID=A0A5N0EJ38_9NOCA|nr:hypothetical protein [Nocardia colli]KAA8887401.1 hypothetical protein F3087_17030 [Nocardia colli]
MTRLAELSGAPRCGRPRGVDGRIDALPVTENAEPLDIPGPSPDRTVMLDATARLDPGVRWDAEQGRAYESAGRSKMMSTPMVPVTVEPGSVASVLVIDRARQLPRDSSHARGGACA